MKLLATTQPNKNYTYLKNLENVRFECRLNDNNVTIHFFEINLKTKKERVVTEESFNYLFPIGIASKNCPFLIHENIDFYVCLRREKYKEKFEKLLKSIK